SVRRSIKRGLLAKWSKARARPGSNSRFHFLPHPRSGLNIRPSQIMSKRRRINWTVSDIARKTRKVWLEASAKLRGQRFYCGALSGESEYNITINCDGTLTCNCHDYNGSGYLGDLNQQ